MTNYMQDFYAESSFGGFSDIDGTVVFFNRVNSLISSSSIVLDVGCGRGSYADDPVPLRRNLRNLRGKAATVIGIDVDSAGRDNPFIDEFRLIVSSRWPVQDGFVDLILCDFVLEHVESPGAFFAEAARVLKPGGYLCIRTPNRWSYIALGARLLPSRYHARITSFCQRGRREKDVFPTFYRCNSVRRLRRMMRDHGFEHVVYNYEAEPSYLSFSKWAYRLGVLHQRFAPRFLKAATFAFGRLTRSPT